MKHRLYLGLGSNLGDRKALILETLRLIDLTVGHMEKVSSFYETEAWGFDSPNRFLNAAVRVTTTLTPHECLLQTQRIERMQGRKLKSTNGQYHDRTIDIDLLLYDDLHINSEDLILPHPRINERDFVLRPLKEILD